MRVLVVAVPQAGHLTPLLRVVRALVAAGDEVTVASGQEVRDQVTASGAAFAVAGSGMQAWFGRLAARTRGAPGDGLAPERISAYFVPRLFAEIGADDMVDGVLAAADAVGPDLVLHDVAAYAGPLAAALRGRPAVRHLVGPFPDPEVEQLVADALSPLWRSFGRDVPAPGGAVAGPTVAICPPSLDPDAAPAGPLLQVRPAPLPVEPVRPQSPPLVYVSFGTLWAEPTLVRTVLDALATEPVQVLATLGALDPAALGAVPANATVERFVPQETVLPRCSAVVHHAGGGTMFGALAHGLPQVALPQAADNFVNAALLGRAGAGRTLLPGETAGPTGVDAVRAAVRAVLDDGRHAAAARTLADEIAAMPAPEELVESLRALTPART